MTKDDIIKQLSLVKYPGFSRDIVSFGMVKDISIEGNNVNITLSIGSSDEEIKKRIRIDIATVLEEKLNIANVGVFILESSGSSQKSTPAAAGAEPMTGETVPGIRHIIAVASGKGGVGKSTVAVNFATALSKDYKVGLLDLDIYGPSLPTVTGVNEVPRLTEDQKIVPIEKFGMKLMSFGFISGNNSPTIWRGPMVARMTQQFFDDVLWGELDFLILDLPPGTGDIQLTLVQKIALTGAIIVTTPQNLALLDVQKGADMFKKVNTPVLGIIENMTHFQCPHCDEITEIFPGSGGTEESNRLDVPLLGQIYLSPELAQASDSGTPYVLQYPDSPITGTYNKIAEKIAEIASSGE